MRCSKPSSRSPQVCCIYHRPKQFGESSSSDESSESDSDAHSDDGRARRRCDHDHDHDGNDHGDHASASRDPQGGSVVHELDSDSDDVNAYERMPRRKPKKTKKVPPKDCEYFRSVMSQSNAAC